MQILIIMQNKCQSLLLYHLKCDWHMYHANALITVAVKRGRKKDMKFIKEKDDNS